MYINLRTGFSFRHAIGKIPEVLDEYQRLFPEEKYAPIADRGYCYGWNEWDTECKKRNLTPIFGVELAVCTEEDLHGNSKPGRDYWIFYAEDIHYLNSILTIATSQSKNIFKGGRNLKFPILSYDQALAQYPYHIIKITSYRANTDELTEILDRFPERKTNLYAGYSNALTYGQYFYQSSILDLPWVLVSENKYPKGEDRALYQNICGRGAIVKTRAQHILSKKEFIDSFNYDFFIKDPLTFYNKCHQERELIFDFCKGTKIKAGGIPKAKGMMAIDEFCYHSLDSMGLNNEVYKERLAKELKLIYQKEYVNYFQIVSNICHWGHQNMLVGPGRGSAAGSLVCYLLGITQVDPIQHDLSFERFLSPDRKDLPDIDIDFADRDRVIDFITNKYGADNTARLGTVNMLGAKSALREAGGSMDIPQYFLTKVADNIIKYPAGSEEAKQALAETLDTTTAGKKLINAFPELEITKRMENHPRHPGVHAAGVIVSETPLKYVGPLNHQDNKTILMLDKEAAEDHELLKIDVLGLTQLSVIDTCLKMIGKNKGILRSLEYTDDNCFQLLRDRKYSGIFQFEGDALQSVSNKFTIESFHDMVIVTSIARKGPLASGAASEWLEKRNSISKKLPKQKYGVYPQLSQILDETFDVIVFQEQIMNICRRFARLPWSDVMGIRKAIGKSKGESAMLKFEEKFKTNLFAKSVDPDTINTLWSEILTHGGYSFNKSHAVCYSVISYWCLYLKAYYPKEFIAATLTHTKDDEKKRNILIEFVEKMGYDYIAVDENLSHGFKWKVAGDRLIGPLVNVKGIGEKTALQVMGARERGDEIKAGTLKKIRNNEVPLRDLYPIRQSALRSVGGDLSAAGVKSEITNISDISIPEQDTYYTIIATPVRLRLRSVNEQKLIERRGGKIIPKDEPLEFMSGTVRDDTDKIVVQINRYDWMKEYSHKMMKDNKMEKGLYAIRGIVRGGRGRTFRIMTIKNFKCLGDM